MTPGRRKESLEPIAATQIEVREVPEANLFRGHNWWHHVLWHLDLWQIDEALVLYDDPIRERRSNVGLDLVDAASLLWRVELCGVFAGDRWDELTGAWMQQEQQGHTS